MPVSGEPSNLYVGREYISTEGELRDTLRQASDDRFDFVVIPLFAKPVNDADPCDGSYKLQPSTLSDLAVDSKTWNSAVVGALSPWINPDSKSKFEQQSVCREALEKELAWASHLGVYGIVLPPPSPKCELYASAVSRALLGGIITHQLLLRMPLMFESSDGTVTDGWETWNKFRLFCDSNSRLQVALELTADLPSTDRELERWYAEPVKSVIVPADVFLTNQKGFPVLSKRHKAFLLKFFKHNVNVIIQGLPDGGCTTDSAQYLHYMARLFQSRDALSAQEQFELPYHDFLQAPLQPLQDNLESQTYETFEKDPIKYVQYEAAIRSCLQDKLRANKKAPFTVIVVGAGRGPLVVAARSAAESAGVQVQVWAVEKNPNAIITLQHRKIIESWQNVEVVGEDMRFWKAPQPADIIVSELLGSFGDNELSPECLDGAQKYLAPDGTCIPQKYTSYLTPVTSNKLWNDVRNYNDTAHFETAYVVKFHQAFHPTSEIKPCFTFEHPNPDMRSNDRYAEIGFGIEVDALVHGFAGYFHCTLYNDLHISIEPNTHSEGMFSWFPIYFPLKVPIVVRKGQRMKSHWWRCHNDKKVWYEWTVSDPAPQPVHNPGGRSYYIGK